MTTTPRKRIAALKTQDITHYVPFIDRPDRPLRIGDSLTASFRGVRVVVDLIDAPATKSEEVPE